MSAPIDVLQHAKSAASASDKAPQKAPPSTIGILLTACEAAQILKVSLSWLAKARMNGDGPPFVKIGRAVRYEQMELHRWMKTKERHSTSEDSAKKRPDFTE
jgi:predicted DNA-binding transcriptional regulator AlpA